MLPSNADRRAHPFRDTRRVVEGIILRSRKGIAWQDLPREQFGSRQTVRKRPSAYAGDGTGDSELSGLIAQADAICDVDWDIEPAHQHGTNTTPGTAHRGQDRPTRARCDRSDAAHGCAVNAAGGSVLAGATRTISVAAVNPAGGLAVQHHQLRSSVVVGLLGYAAWAYGSRFFDRRRRVRPAVSAAAEPAEENSSPHA